MKKSTRQELKKMKGLIAVQTKQIDNMFEWFENIAERVSKLEQPTTSEAHDAAIRDERPAPMPPAPTDDEPAHREHIVIEDDEPTPVEDGDDN